MINARHTNACGLCDSVGLCMTFIGEVGVNTRYKTQHLSPLVRKLACHPKRWQTLWLASAVQRFKLDSARSLKWELQVPPLLQLFRAISVWTSKNIGALLSVFHCLNSPTGLPSPQPFTPPSAPFIHSTPHRFLPLDLLCITQ